MEGRFGRVIAQFDRYISYTLIVVGMMFAIYQTLDLVFLFAGRIYRTIQDRQFYLHEEGMPIAGLFFGILLTLEILETVKVFSQGHVVKIRIILLVGLIAITRKILMADLSHVEPMAEFSIAAVILALSIGYFLVTRASAKNSTNGKE